MAPESTTTQAARPASGQTVNVPAPAGGAQEHVASSPSGELVLGFDPSTATASRPEGSNDLVFSLDGGGTVTISDFFVVGDESLPNLKLPDGTVVASEDFFAGSDLDMTTAAGPSASAPQSSGSDGSGDPLLMTGGVDKLGDQGTWFWGRNNEVGDEMEGLRWPTLQFGINAYDVQTYNINESDPGTSLNIRLSFGASGPVTLTFHVGGNALANNGVDADGQLVAEFRAEFDITDLSGPGYTATYDPVNGTLTVTVDSGVTEVAVPISLLDDHINDGGKQIVFTLTDVDGNVRWSGPGTYAVVNISEDNIVADNNATSDSFELDGPIVGVALAKDVSLTSYEGSPDGNIFPIKLTLTDPHSITVDNPGGSPYEGYNGNKFLSQDMTIVLKVGSNSENGAEYGQDYEFSYESLGALREMEGVKSVDVGDDGTVTIVLNGQVSENGTLYTDPEYKPFDLDKVDDLTLDIKVLINSTGEQESAPEDFFVYVDAEGTGGNESSADSRELGFEIAPDPVLSLVFVQTGDGAAIVGESGVDADTPSTLGVILDFNKEIHDDVTVRATLTVGGDATLWNGVDDDRYRADYFLPGTFNDDGSFAGTTTPTGGYETKVQINGYDVTFTYTYDSITDTVKITVEGPGAAFDTAAGYGSELFDDAIRFDFIINDDHITEKGNEGTERITLTLDSVELDDGYSGYKSFDNNSGESMGGGVSVDADKNTDRATINEDRAEANTDGESGENEKDGPVVGITVKDGSGGAASDSANVDEEDGAKLVFNITLTDPHSITDTYPGDDYVGYPGAGGETGNLSQDMTLTIEVGGDADYGDDYTFDFSKLDALMDSGVLTYSFEDGVITITLNGLTDSNGMPYNDPDHPDYDPDRPVFNMDDIGKLQITADIVNDMETEREAESITLTVTTDGGNESTGEGTATGTINEDRESRFNGPVIILSGPAEVTESGSPDPLDAVKHNTAEYVIKLTSKDDAEVPQASTESIRSVITITAKGADTKLAAGMEDENLGDGDYFFSGTLTAVVDGTEVALVQATSLDEYLAGTGDYYYNASTGQIYLTMREGTTEVKFTVDIVDDLRETGDASLEGIDVQFDLVNVDANGVREDQPGYDGTKNPLPDGEASVSGSGLVETIITPDIRPGGTGNDHFSPENFDGPYVHLSADKETITESEKLRRDGNDDPNIVTFTVNLTDPAGGGSGAAFIATEDVIVTLTLKGVTDTFNLEYNNKFQYGDLELDVRTDGGVSVLFDANGDEVGVFVYDAATGTATIQVTIAEGQSEFEFSLQAHDDSLQGPKHDVADEEFSLTITDVVGNEARVLEEDREPVTVTITDDNPAIPVTLEGVKVGLEWNSTLISGTAGEQLLGEGNDYTLGIKLYAVVSNMLTPLDTGNNPYANYTGNLLPDDLTITMNLSPAGANDATFTLTQALLNLISSGQVIIMLEGGTVYKAGNLPDLNTAFTGEITVTLVGGAFDVNNANNLTFTANIHGDNVNEWDHKNTYADDPDGIDKLNELVKVKITGVDGNESSLASGKTELENAITDRADGKLTLTGGGFDNTADTWSFKVAVVYPDKEKLNDPSSATEAKLPGETVHTQIRFTDSAAMQHGEEYKMDAYTLFLSLNKGDADLQEARDAIAAIKALNPGMTDLEAYNQWLDTQGDLYDAAETTGLILVTGDDAGWDKGDSIAYDVYVPEDSWPADGQLSFTVEQGDSKGVAGGQDGFTVEMVQPGQTDGVPEYDIKGEIITATGSGEAEIPGDKLLMGIDGGKNLYEDADIIQKNGEGVARTESAYTVYFKDGDGNPLEAGTSAAGDISFTLTLKPDAGMNFDQNLTDNYLDNYDGGEGTGDLAVAGVGEYSSLNGTDDPTSLLSLLNTWLEANQEGVTITDIYMAGNEVKFSITVAEGYDLSKGVTINFKALDDSVNDNSEKFTLQLSGVSSKTGDTPDTLHIKISNDRSETTTIHDESPNTGAAIAARNGFAIALEESSGFEASASQNQIYVTTRAYILDDTSNTPTTLEALYQAYLEYGGASLGDSPSPADFAASTAFTSFVNKFFGPTQDIIVTYTLDGKDSAADGQDYMNDTQHTFKQGDWTLVIDADGNVYYEASGENGLPIETIKDRYSEGDETLIIDLTGADGNESRPYDASKDDADARTDSDKATVTIKDVHDGPAIIKLGPAGGIVMEPVDHEHGPKNGEENEADPRSVTYALSLDQAVVEDTIVWLKNSSTATEGADYSFGTRMYWSDGEGECYAYNADGQKTLMSEAEFKALFTGGEIPKYFQDQQGYFVIVKEGDAAVEFEILIKDDNDTANTGGKDVIHQEDIILSVDAVQGGEVCTEGAGGNIPWDPEASFEYVINGHTGIVDPVEGTFTYKKEDDDGKEELVVAIFGEDSWLGSIPTAKADSTWDPKTSETILDDMKGPKISFGAERIDWSDTPVEEAAFKITMEDYCSEDVTVTIQLFSAADGSSQTLTLTIPKGSLGGDYTMQQLIDQNPDATLPNGDFYLQISTSDGGETRRDDTPLYMDSDSGTTSIVLDNFNSTKIAEGGVDGATYPEYSFDLSGIDAGTLTDVTFDITLLPGTAGTDDMTDGKFGSESGKITVTIDETDLAQFVNNGGEGRFVIKAEPDGTAKVYWDKNRDGSDLVDLPNSKVTDAEGNPVKLPSAILDNKLEGDENFHAIITSPGGVDIDAGVATTVVEDRTNAKVMFFDENGDPFDANSYPEGTEVTVVGKLVLTNKDGDPIDLEGNPVTDSGGYVFVTANDPLEFDVNYSDGTALQYADYSGDNRFHISAGKSEGSFTVIIHEDMTTEGNEDFFISAEISEGSKKDYPDLTERLLESDQDVTITITNTQSGPLIKWDVADTVKEGRSLAVNFGSYIRGEGDAVTSVRQVVEENVTLTFTLAPKTGSDLTIADDIAQIKIGDYTFTINPDGTVSCDGIPPAGINVVNNGDGTYTITATLPEGAALGSITLVPRQDNLTELEDKFTLKLDSVKGSETDIASGYEGEKTVQIQDDDSGYKIAIAAVNGHESEEAGVVVNFGGTMANAPGEDVVVTLTLDDAAKAMLDETGIISITLPNGSEVSFNLADSTGNPGWITYADGKLVLSVPPSYMGQPGDLIVLFPMQDNSILGTNENFTIGVGVTGGETVFNNSPTFGSEFKSETAANGSNEGGVTEFSVTHNTGSGDLKAVVGEVKITVSGADESVVSKIIIDGVPYTQDPGDGSTGNYWTLSGGKIVIDGLDVKGSYDVDVVYKAGVDSGSAKANVDVSADLVNAGHGVTVNVTDESNSAEYDGPIASLAMAADTVTEGAGLAGTLTIELPNLPGDPDGVSVGTVEDLFVTLKISGPNPDGSYNTLALSTEASDGGYSIKSQANGTVTIKIPAGTEHSGSIDVGFIVNVPDNSLADNPDFTITVTDITGGTGDTHYETYSVNADASASGDIRVTDNDVNSGPTFTVTAPPQAAEGGSVTFTISGGSRTGEGWKDVPNGTQVILKVQIDGLQEGDVVKQGTTDLTPYKDGDVWYVDVTVTKGASGNPSASITVTTQDNATVDSPRTISVSVVEETGGTLIFETVKSGNAATTTIVDDADGFHLSVTGAQASDGSNAMTFNIVLAAQGDFFSVDDAIASAISFDLNLTGFSVEQMQAIAAALGQENVSATYESGVVHVTLGADYVYDPTVPLTFTVQGQEAAQDVDHVYEVAIDNVVSGLEVADVGSSADATVTVDLALGNSADTVGQTLYGGAGDDTIYGGAGDDTIYGGDGDDIIYAGSGLDILNGGNGDDIFVWAGNSFNTSEIADVINGFTYKSDMIGLKDLFAGGEEDLTTLLDNLAQGDQENKFSAQGDDGISISVTLSQDKLELTLVHDDNTQNITINAAAGSTFFDGPSPDITQAQQILENILKTYSD